MAQMPVLELYALLLELAPKHRFHPIHGTDPRGVALTESQLGFVAQYDATFAEFRGECGRVLQRAAAGHPEATNAYLLQLLRGLRDPAGGPEDKRTARGYVFYGSSTYVAWEVVSFMLDHLSVALTCSSGRYAMDCLDALRARLPSDAVLTPLFLNMLACFWRGPPAEAETARLVQASVEVLFGFLEAASRRGVRARMSMRWRLSDGRTPCW